MVILSNAGLSFLFLPQIPSSNPVLKSRPASTHMHRGISAFPCP